MTERDAQRERCVALVARVVVQAANRVERDLVVVLELVRHLRDAGLRDGGHRVVPPVDALAGLAPVRSPAEVPGIDVGREPLLEPVQLVGADEVHLPAQARAVALEPKVVREGRDRRAKLGGVVVRASARGQRSGHERRPRGPAERARGVRVLENDTFLGEAVDRRTFRHRVPVGAEEQRGELVDHDDEDVRTLAHRREDTVSDTALRNHAGLRAFGVRNRCIDSAARVPSLEHVEHRLGRAPVGELLRQLAVPAGVRVHDEPGCRRSR